MRVQREVLSLAGRCTRLPLPVVGDVSLLTGVAGPD